VTLARDRGLDIADSTNIYRCAMNHAAAADLVTTVIRQGARGEAWIDAGHAHRGAPPISGWQTSAFMDASSAKLRQFIAVSHWSEEREFFEKHSWKVLGEIAYWGEPMELVVAVLGPMSGGRRHSHWSKAQLHPQGSELRFRIRRRRSTEGFRETWLPVYREDHDEISREKWIQGMLDDDVIRDSLFVVNVPVPDEAALQQIRNLASQQLENARIFYLPAKQLSTCHNPIAPCPFRACCWSEPESKPEDGGYDSS
jgi:hypothetical protein